MRRAGATAVVLLAASCSSGATPDPGTTTSTSGGGTSTTETGGTGGAGGSAGDGGGPGYDYCTACHPPSVHGTIQDAELDAVSGLAASRAHDGVYYAHNDAGDAPRFFATNLLGEDLGRYELSGAEHVDWEDCAMGPCGAASCLYLADIGDATQSRSTYAIYRVAEPATLSAGSHAVTYDRYPFQYPDGAHNANTLLIHPETGEMVVVTTVFGGPSPAYRFPLPLAADTMVTLEAVDGVEPPSGSPELTGGDVHPEGLGMLLQTRTTMFFLPLSSGTIADGLSDTACSMPRAAESQGESVAWSTSGDGYATVSEGAGSSLSFINCP